MNFHIPKGSGVLPIFFVPAFPGLQNRCETAGVKYNK